MLWHQQHNTLVIKCLGQEMLRYVSIATWILKLYLYYSTKGTEWIKSTCTIHYCFLDKKTDSDGVRFGQDRLPVHVNFIYDNDNALNIEISQQCSCTRTLPLFLDKATLRFWRSNVALVWPKCVCIIAITFAWLTTQHVATHTHTHTSPVLWCNTHFNLDKYRMQEFYDNKLIEVYQLH